MDLGQKVAVLVDSHEEAGYKAVHWNAKNEKGTSLPGGVYFCRLQACGRILTEKIVLLE